MVYAVRMMLFGVALLIAARPDLDNPGCYRDGWDYFRAICEVITILLFLFKIGREVGKIIRLVAKYFAVTICSYLKTQMLLTVSPQFQEGLLQIPQLPAVACSYPAQLCHLFPGRHHMVCLNWSWLLRETRSQSELHHDLGH